MTPFRDEDKFSWDQKPLLILKSLLILGIFFVT